MAQLSGRGYFNLVKLPKAQVSPFRELTKRGLLAVGCVLLSTAIVWIDRDSYADSASGGTVTLVDALYYSTVTITTTGYGDITPITMHARLISALIVTPLRILFLVILVGTTIEVLADEGVRRMADAKWRKKMRNHTLVIGYGTKGRSAVGTLRRNGVPLNKIVVIDTSSTAVADANRDGIAAFEGNGSRRELLHQAEISKAREVIVALPRDDAAILTTLTVRQLNPNAGIVVSVREQENVPLVRQSGATSVVTSSEAVGRLMGLSAVGPHIGNIIQDLLSAGEGLEVTQRQALPSEVGRSPASMPGERVLGVVRNGTLRRFFDPTVAQVELGDELILVRRSCSKTPEAREEP